MKPFQGVSKAPCDHTVGRKTCVNTKNNFNFEVTSSHCKQLQKWVILGMVLRAEQQLYFEHQPDTKLLF